MTMFLIQALLWLLVAFLLGYGIGRFLKGLFCQQRQDHERDVSVPASLKPAQTVAVASGTAAAVATLAQVREKLNANADLPDVSVQAPRVDLPEVAVAAPEVALSVPEVTGQAVPDINVQLPDVEGIDVPEVDLPDMMLQAPALDVDLPVVDVDVPTVEVGLPEVDVTLPAVEVSLPDVPVDLPEASVVDTGLDWLDAAKAAVIAGGAGLVAKAGSMLDFDSIDPHKPIGIDPHLPIIDPPDLDVSLPEVALSVPEVARQAVPDINVQLPDVEGLDVPEVDLPDMTLQAPALDVDLPVVDVDVPTVEVGLPEVDVTLPAVEVSLPDVPVDLPEASVVDTGLDWLDAAKAAVIAGGAGLVAKAGSMLDFDSIDPHKPIGIDPHLPIIDPPDLDVSLPEVALSVPEVAVAAPEVALSVPEVAVAAPEVALSVPEVAGQAVPDINVQLPDVEGIDVPEVDLPDMTLQAPALDVDLPVVDVDVPTVEVGLPEVDVTLPAVEVSLPDVPVDLPEASVVDTGLDWLDAAKAAVIAGGAGLVAKAAAAGDAIQDVLVGEAGDDGEDESDWLLLLVQQAKAAYQGKNLHAVSELWHSGSGYDCSALDRYETLALLPSQYDKLGSSHCGVPKAGFVAVGGDVSDIEQGMAVLFHYPNIVVCRDVDDNHHFIRVMA
ncbi:MAG TPA: hypothetical protein PLE99_07420 [Candidatus Thiothrix moscowensis]|uniref:hypothetical protein n=2 Tax=Thiothrix TaxID=1030 RepID=UPI002616C859|nr:hypothetical protein [uncultured Thiothrix sp.]HRJ52580.1 hypothetical protein [Candidatus Thiothrix moscowensis]HRJ94276.1 hypothetical protein [Candidatus Thiothrix moscowensis]